MRVFGLVEEEEEKWKEKRESCHRKKASLPYTHLQQEVKVTRRREEGENAGKIKKERKKQERKMKARKKKKERKIGFPRAHFCCRSDPKGSEQPRQAMPSRSGGGLTLNRLGGFPKKAYLNGLMTGDCSSYRLHHPLTLQSDLTEGLKESDQ